MLYFHHRQLVKSHQLVFVPSELFFSRFSSFCRILPPGHGDPVLTGYWLGVYSYLYVCVIDAVAVWRKQVRMERESNPMQAMCRSGCGFYGSPATDGLCSLCYKEALKKKQQPPNTAPSNTGSGGSATNFGSTTGPNSVSVAPSSIDTAQPTIPVIVPPTTTTDLMKDSADGEGAVGGGGSSAESSVSSGDVDDSFDGKDSDKEGKKKKNRCAVCRKKVGLTGFECRCGGLFCAVHRYSDKHNCTFDYREMGAQEIRRNNPVVVGEKIQKI